VLVITTRGPVVCWWVGGGGGDGVGGGGVRHAVVLGAGYVQAPGSLTERS
jgi:hypothetical protein